VHKFILSDNRHYIFYIWKNLLSKPALRYSMCIVYSLAFIFIFRLIVNSQEKLLKIILHLLFTFIVLVVSGLVEFRYYTLPLVYLAFEITNRKKSLDIEGIHYKETYGTLDRMYPTILLRVLLNVGLMYVFLFRPFGQGGRFMW
jgi:alpha-1,2-glucosyltransferase